MAAQSTEQQRIADYAHGWNDAAFGCFLTASPTHWSLHRKLQTFARATTNQIYDAERNDPWLVAVQETKETIGQFITRVGSWHNNTMEVGVLAGLPFVCWPARGYPLGPFSVIDFGQCRYMIQADLMKFVI